uniref:uncharacterized protein n=1 Tax=Pristiophorus japonicus TaxID=55135 RepID=UPI00398E32AD
MAGLVLLLLAVWAALGAAAGAGERDLAEHGRQQLQRLRERALSPGAAPCWARALRRAEQGPGCGQLQEGERRRRLALELALCHLESSGKSFPPCTESSSILECTQDMDAVAFGAYTAFFTHAQSICYYLQSETWQQQTEDTINRLAVNSETIAQQLEMTKEMASEIIEAQNATLKAQDQILLNGDTLRHTLQESTQGVRQVFREMQESTQEHRQLFAEIFHRLSYLHQFVMVESSAFYSYLYSLLSLAVVFLLTSAQRTAAARLMLFLLIAFSVYLERLVYSSEIGPLESSFEYTERIYCRIWLLRKVVMGAGALVLAYFIATYQDVARQNLELLRSLRQTQSSLQHVIEEAEKIMKAPLPPPSPGPWRGGRLQNTEVDSGIADTRIGNAESLSSGAALQLEDFAACHTSTPKKSRASPPSPCRSAAKKRKAKSSDVSVYNILVSESPSKYNLRNRKHSGRVAAVLR